MKDKEKHRERKSRSLFFNRKNVVRLHPLFVAVGLFYALKGELFLFLLSALVAIEHECAHAFAAAKLGYKLNKIVLMPFGAVIDGDMRANFKDEIVVALWGPLSNLFTAAFFAAVWWFEPTVYAFTDTAYFSSLSIALVNLLPAYPLDGGRILRAALARSFSKRYAETAKAEKKAAKICALLSLVIATLALTIFIISIFRKTPNLSLLPFASFLFVGVIGNKNSPATYEKMDFSCGDAIKKGVELRRVAVSEHCPIKNALRYISPGSYLVLEVYDDNEQKRFELPQNELSEYFQRAPSPYTTLGELFLYKNTKTS